MNTVNYVDNSEVQTQQEGVYTKLDPSSPTSHQTAQQPTYQPVGVPAVASSHSGKIQAILGIISGVISLLFFPIVFGPAGIILGSLASSKGEKTIGMVAIVISSIFMILGMIAGFYFTLHPEYFEASEAAAAVGFVQPFFK